MDEIVAKNNKVLELLIEENLITESQCARLKVALECGMMLNEAMEKVPLVDPIKFAGIQTIAERSLKAAPGNKSIPEGAPAGDSPKLSSVPSSKEEEPVLELDEEDHQPIELDSGSFKIENLGPVGANAEKIPPCKPDNDTPVKERDVPLEKGEKEKKSSMIFEIRGKLETTADVLEERIKKRRKEQGAMDWQGKSGEQEVEKVNKTDADNYAMDPSMDEVALPEDKPDENPSTAKDVPFDLDLDLDMDFDFDEPEEEPKPVSGLDIPPLMIKKSELNPEEIERDKKRFAKDLVDAVGKQGLNTEYREEVARAMSSVLDDAFNDSFDSSMRKSDVFKQRSFSNDDSERLPPLGAMASYGKPGVEPATFDLHDDEGINIIAEVNEFLVNAMKNAEGGFIIDPAQEENNLKLFSKMAKMVSLETVEANLLEKILNRLKVMGRLESWRSNESLKGIFYTTRGAQKTTVYLDAEKADDGGRVVVHFHHQ